LNGFTALDLQKGSNHAALYLSLSVSVNSRMPAWTKEFMVKAERSERLGGRWDVE